MLIIVFGILYFYVSSHKKELIQRASAGLSSKLKAKVNINDAGISWLATFPYISVALEGISIIDTTYNANSPAFFKAEYMYVSCDLVKLITGKVHISRIQFSDGTLNFLRDSTGKSNLHILDRQPDTKINHDTTAKTPFTLLVLDNIKIFFNDKSEYKKYDLLIRRIECLSTVEDSLVRYQVVLDMHVNYLGLNMRDGTYGRNKDLGGRFSVFYNPKSQKLNLHDITLMLNKEPVIADGYFCMDTAKHFHLHLSANSINYENAATAALERSQTLLGMFKAAKPISVDMDLVGNTKYMSVPNVKLTLTVIDNTIRTPAGTFSKSSFTATYIDNVKALKPLIDFNPDYVDANSRFSINNLAATWKDNSVIYSHAIVITDLVHPVVHLELAADLSLPDMDSLIQSNNFSLQHGNAKINLVYNGPVDDSDRIAPDIVGNIVLRNANVLYEPRNIELKNGTAVLRFNHTDFSIEKLSGKVGNSVISISSKVNSFAPLFEHDRPLILRWNISSPMIDVSEWIPLINSRKVVKRTTPKEQKQVLAGISDALDRFTDKCDIDAIFSVNKVEYGHFEGQNLYADLALSYNNGWQIKKISMNEGQGNISVSGNIEQKDNDDKHFLTVATSLSNVDLAKTFYAFNNFGMKSFNYTNLKGKVSAQAKLKLTLDGKDNIIPGSIKGALTFQVYNGHLIDFKPIQEVCKKIFPNRDFKDIGFAELSDKVTVTGNIIKVNRMEIASSVLHLYVEGNYDLSGAKTDLLIQVPIDNLSKKEVKKIYKENGVRGKHELSVYVRATQNAGNDFNFKYNFTGKLPKPQDSTGTAARDSLRVVK